MIDDNEDEDMIIDPVLGPIPVREWKGRQLEAIVDKDFQELTERARQLYNKGQSQRVICRGDSQSLLITQEPVYCYLRRDGTIEGPWSQQTVRDLAEAQAYLDEYGPKFEQIKHLVERIKLDLPASFFIQPDTTKQ